MKIIGKKALFLLLSITMLICRVPMDRLAVSAKEVDTAIADGGTGTLSDPYLISTAEQMQNVSKNLSSCFKLTEDIDVGNITPIGDMAKPFIGVFDGDGHTITVDITTSGEYAGLFGYVGGAIKNLGVIGNIKDSGARFIGALVGQAYRNGYIENCFSDCEIEITAQSNSPYIGGLVGFNYGRIINCYSKGNLLGGDLVYANSSIGGFVGGNYGYIINCYSTANITVNSNLYYAGGFVGESKNFEIVNCYATGNIKEMTGSTNSNKGAGGFAGCIINTKISNCYSTGSIDTANNVGGFIGIVHSKSTKIDILQAYFNKDSEQKSQGIIQEPKGIGCNQSSISDTGKVLGKSTDEMTDTSFAELLSTSTVFPCEWKNDDTNQNYPSIVSNKGTEEDPFIISNASQMEIVCNYPFGHYELTEDITVNNLSPIGTFENSFYGVFDGGGHTITITADTNTITGSDCTYVGLFGVIEQSGKVQNLNLKGSVKASQSSGTNLIGGLVAQNYGTIADCSVDVNIDGSAEDDSVQYIRVGALAGINVGFITDCHAEGTVIATNSKRSTGNSTDVGGLVGENLVDTGDGYIVNSSASCKITVNDGPSTVIVGSLVGVSNGNLENCIATGEVSGESKVETQVGGFVGQNSGNISGSYATGLVKGNGTKVLAGGFAAFSWDGSIIGCYSAKGSIFIDTCNDARAGGFIAQNQETSSIEKCYSTGKVKAVNSKMVRAGGFTGYNRSGAIKDCYTSSDVEGSVSGTLTAGAIGGFAGTNLSTINGCYAVGTVKAAKTESDLSSVLDPETFIFRTDVSSGSAVSVAGFTALNTSTGTIANGFFDVETTGQAIGVGENYNTTGSVNATGLQTSEMTGTVAESKMSGLDFDSVWKTTDNTKQYWFYPQLALVANLNPEASLDSVTLPISPLEITAFDALPASTAVQEVANGTPRSNLKLLIL